MPFLGVVIDSVFSFVWIKIWLKAVIILNSLQLIVSVNMISRFTEKCLHNVDFTQFNFLYFESIGSSVDESRSIYALSSEQLGPVV